MCYIVELRKYMKFITKHNLFNQFRKYQEETKNSNTNECLKLFYEREVNKYV